jgi:hypothetical protein
MIILDQVLRDSHGHASYQKDSSVRKSLESKVAYFSRIYITELANHLHAEFIVLVHSRLNYILRSNFVRMLARLKDARKVRVILLHEFVNERDSWASADSFH